jgi:predicted XRE-type DNA-binding protein
MTRRAKMVRGSSNVFRDLGFREPEARNLALRSEVMIRIEEFVERSGMTQARALMWKDLRTASLLYLKCFAGFTSY